LADTSGLFRSARRAALCTETNLAVIGLGLGLGLIFGFDVVRRSLPGAAGFRSQSQTRSKERPLAEEDARHRSAMLRLLIKKPATKARKGINPFTKEPTIFKAKPARKIIKARPVKAAKDAIL
jgi:hypothetical protein